MKLWKVVGDGFAVLAILIAIFGVVLTLIGLKSRDWQWSNAMLLLALVISGITIICLALSFREPSRSRLVYGSIALVGANLLLYAIFDRNPLEF